MSKIAIKGHLTRGKEVIELLEMLGGVNWHGCAGNRLDSAYYISDSKAILFDDTYDIVFEDGIKEFITFTIEEFLEKFPYKVDNRIRYNTKNGNIGDIISMVWDERINDIIYTIAFSHGYKELTIDKIIPYKTNYPSTYSECCSILQINNCFSLTYNNIDNKYITSYEYQLMLYMDKLRKLKVCRDAYWKIAGEEMGLGKPWEPDLENEELYCIVNYNKQIIKSKTNTAFNKILIFPTEEMRDAFYENFKVLIECCKEYL